MADDNDVKHQVEGDIDLKGVELDRTVPLRIAAVHDGTILASDTIEVKEAKPSKVAFRLEFVLPYPCGFRVILGRADAPNHVFMSSELASATVTPSVREPRPGAKAAAAAAVSAKVSLVVDPARYRLWLGWCRRYHVRGRVVCRHWRWDGRRFRFCDDPVPAATVELYDVDCFWWFCRRDLITTATTNPDGTFEADFWWCCAPWRPWHPGDWVIDPDLLDRIRRLIEEVRPRLPIPLPDPPPDPFQLQPFLDRLGAALTMADTRRPSLASATRTLEPLSDAEIVARLPRLPELELLHVYPWCPISDCAPDLLFRVTQNCGGQTEVIVSEGLARTRWNIPTSLSVTLVANEKACCIPVCEDPPCGDCFKFAVVGCTAVSDIGGNNPSVPVAAELKGLASPGSADIAFARTMSITGVFGSTAGVDYYEIEYSRDGSPFGPLPLSTLVAFSRQFWGPPCGGGASAFNWQPFPVVTKQDAATSANHFVYETHEHFEQGCDPGSWGNIAFPGGGRWWTVNRDMALVWQTADLAGAAETPLLPDGLYELRIVGWNVNAAGKLVTPRVLPRCNTPAEERLIIRLDNRKIIDHPPSTPSHPWGPGFLHVPTVDPDCAFIKIVKNEGRAGTVLVGACDIVELTNTDSLTIHFSVTVPAPDTDRHLGGYWMTVHHGVSAVFDAIGASVGGVQGDPTPEVGPTYALALGQGAVRRWWGGGGYKLELLGSAFPETCAYLFQLHAYKRVFNGCASIEWFHANDSEISLTIKKV